MHATVLSRPYCHVILIFVTLRRNVQVKELATTFPLSYIHVRAVSHTENATTEAATREYGMDMERIQAWRNHVYIYILIGALHANHS